MLMKGCLLRVSFIIYLLGSIYGNTTECFDINCWSCNDGEFGSCLECKPEFKWIDGKCPCNDPNCLKCTSSLIGACDKCKPNFVLYQKMCYGLISNCNIHGETGCNKCNTGYVYNEIKNTCVRDMSLSTKPSCFDQNCEYCTNENEGSCTSCKKGYEYNRGGCRTTAPCLTTRTNTSGEYCESCPEGTYLYQNYCYALCMGHSCELNSGGHSILCENKCLSCYYVYLFESINCTPENYCHDQHCSQCTSSDDGDCHRCEIGYSLNSGKCFKCNTSNCWSCAYTWDKNKCDLCVNNYDLNDGYCFLNTTSLELYPSNPRFTTNPDSESETEPDTNPNSNGNGNDIENEIPIDKSEISCEVPNCKQCLQNGICYECLDKDNYEVKNGLCELKCGVDNCESCSGKDICEACNEGYEIDWVQNKCWQKCADPWCHTCLSGKWCIKCLDGYHFSGSSCTPDCVDENCKYCSNAETCQTCSLGYVLNNYRCNPCFDSACTICTSGLEFACSSCKANYKISNGICAEKSNRIQNCNYSIINDSECIECKEGCAIEDGECKCGASIFNIIWVIILIAAFIGLGFFCYVGFVKKKEQQNEFFQREHERIHHSNINVEFGVIGASSISARQGWNKNQMHEKFEDEFNKNRFENNKVKILCGFCNCQEGTYAADCGCFLCKEHSRPIKDANDEDTKNKRCPVCMKIVNKIQIRKEPCGICLQPKKAWSNFSCKCAIKVCKECYIKCRFGGNNCPACRTAWE